MLGPRARRQLAMAGRASSVSSGPHSQPWCEVYGAIGLDA